MPGPRQPGYDPGLWRLRVGQPVPWVDTTQGPAGMFIQLVRTPRIATRTSYGFIAPNKLGVAGFSQKLNVNTTQSPRVARAAHYKLRSPVVVGPGIAFRPVSVKLVQPARARFVNRSHLSSPTVTLAPASALARPINTVLSIFRGRRKTVSVLGAPPIVGAPLVSLKGLLRITLAPQPAQTRHVGRYGVAPPQTVNTGHPDRIKTTLIQVSRIAIQAHYKLRLPTVLSSVAAPIFFSGKAKFVRTPRTKTKSFLRPPVVVAPVLSKPIRITLAPTIRPARATHYVVRKPIVLTQPLPARDQLKLIVKLTYSHKISRNSHNKNVRPPVVVFPFVPPAPDNPPITPTNTGAFVDHRGGRYEVQRPDLFNPVQPRRRNVR